MDRRTFIVAIGGALASASIALAQQPGKVFRLGWLSGSSVAKTPSGEAFSAGMRELG